MSLKTLFIWVFCQNLSKKTSSLGRLPYLNCNYYLFVLKSLSSSTGPECHYSADCSTADRVTEQVIYAKSRIARALAYSVVSHGSAVPVVP